MRQGMSKQNDNSDIIEIQITSHYKFVIKIGDTEFFVYEKNVKRSNAGL